MGCSGSAYFLIGRRFLSLLRRLQLQVQCCHLPVQGEHEAWPVSECTWCGALLCMGSFTDATITATVTAAPVGAKDVP